MLKMKAIIILILHNFVLNSNVILQEINKSW
uniref:Uncharacterized protein n=1 Tax=Anguilla anguilla TaxID=7936 RepID=A0A0E9T7Z2_ANGAN